MRLMVGMEVSASMEQAVLMCMVMVVLELAVPLCVVLQVMAQAWRVVLSVMAQAQHKDRLDLSYNNQSRLYPGPRRRILYPIQTIQAKPNLQSLNAKHSRILVITGSVPRARCTRWHSGLIRLMCPKFQSQPSKEYKWCSIQT